MNADVSLIVTHSRNVLPLADASLSDGYFYKSLPLCVIDAVFSLGVRYEGVENTIDSYCCHFKLSKFRNPREVIPSESEQESISSFCNKTEKLGIEFMTANVFDNRQRTSTQSGILKADAAYRFASALKSHGVEYFKDVGAAAKNVALDKQILKIPGQGKGISLKYFFMLAGSEDLIKPDRMIEAYLFSLLHRKVNNQEAQDLLLESSQQICIEYPHIKARLLDHEIWKYQRAQKDKPLKSISGGSGGLKRQPSKGIKESDALNLMSAYYQKNKSTLPTSIRGQRDLIVRLIMEGRTSEEAFSKAMACGI